MTDTNGNVVSKATPSGVTTFSYDPLDRIDLEAGPAGARNHDFDAGGNRTTDGAGTTASFTPGSDRIATINGVSVTLDAAGNLISDGTYKYLWNSLGQLGELRKPDNTLIASYHYDHQNLRTRKVTTAAAPQGAGKTFYHYDQAGHLIAETTPGNQPQATYIWNGDTLTGLIVHQPQRIVYTVQTDQLGSPFQVRTPAGQVVWRWESEAFGKTLPNEDADGDGNKLTLNLRFPGQYFDRESGLHYNWNRYYSPRLGRYLSPDPIGLSGGLNLYAYVGGNPVSFIDPLGLFYYNNPDPTVTTPLTGPTLTSLECLERCVRSRTPGNVDLRISGGEEAKGHSRNSEHPKATACDISGPQRNRGIDNADMFDCASQCGFGAGQFERFTRTPDRNHWHFQLFPSNGVPPMPGNPSSLPNSPYDMGPQYLRTIPR